MPEQKFLADGPVVMAYPARFESNGEGVEITFPDLVDVRATAAKGEDPFSLARSALNNAIAGLIVSRSPIPAPSRAARRSYGDGDNRFERIVPVDHTLGMKAILWDNMRGKSISNVTMAKALSCDEKEIRRLLDPATTSRSRLADALEAVGCPIAITMVDTSRPKRILKLPGQPGGHTPDLKTVVAAPGVIKRE